MNSLTDFIKMKLQIARYLDQSFKTSLSSFSGRPQWPGRVARFSEGTLTVLIQWRRHWGLNNAWCFVGDATYVWPCLQWDHEFFKGGKEKQSKWTSLDLCGEVICCSYLLRVCREHLCYFYKCIIESIIYSFKFSCTGLTDDRFLLEFSLRERGGTLMNQYALFLSEKNYIKCYVSHFGFNFQEI